MFNKSSSSLSLSSPSSPSSSSDVALSPLAKPSVFPKRCDCVGYLDIRKRSIEKESQKRSSSFKFTSIFPPSWEHKYARLANNFLLVAANASRAAKIEETIYLEGSHVSMTTKKRGLTFELLLNNTRYTFRAPSPAKCKKWTARIKRASRLGIQELYQNFAQIGGGKNSAVFVAQSIETGDEVVIKEMEISKKNRQMLKNEVNILKQLDHPNVVQLFGIFETKKTLHLVMERCVGGELYEQIAALNGERGFSERECMGVLQQIVSAVQYMHSMGIVHRDLKPENILCVYPNSIERVKVADFGISEDISELKARRVQYHKQRRKRNDEENENPDDEEKTDDEEKASRNTNPIMGSLPYVAPEILKLRPYDERVDCWSIGVIAFTLLCGSPPFHDDNTRDMRQSILHKPLVLDEEYWAHVSESGKAMVLGLLQRNPSERMGLDEVLRQTRLSTARQTFSPKAAKKFRTTVAERRVHSNAFPFEECKERTAQANVKQHFKSPPQSFESTPSLASGGISRTDDHILNLVSSPRAFGSPAKMFGDDDDEHVLLGSPRRRKHSQ